MDIKENEKEHNSDHKEDRLPLFLCATSYHIFFVIIHDFDVLPMISGFFSSILLRTTGKINVVTKAIKTRLEYTSFSMRPAWRASKAKANSTAPRLFIPQPTR